MKKSKFLLLLLLIASLATLLPAQAFAVDEPTTAAEAAILMDVSTGEVFYEKNADAAMQPASTTKVMTALLTVEAIERGDFSIDDSVEAYDDCQYGMDEDSSNASPTIEPGEVLSVRDLLYCTMLASANEAANILAEYIAGSISSFVVLMNERAAELGCTQTHFNNPNGIEDASHYCSARDMALIAAEAAQHEALTEICSAPTYAVGATNLHGERSLENTNALLRDGGKYYFAECYGIKTGYFENAGSCLVAAAEKNNVNLVCVVFNAPRDQDSNYYGHYEDAITLFNWVFDNYSYQPVLSSTESVLNVPVNIGVGDSVAARPETAINVLLPNDFDTSTLDYQYIVYSERDGVTLEAPVSAGTILGEVTVSSGDRVFGTSNLVATNSVDMSKTVYLKSSVNSILQQPTVRKLLILLIVVVAIYIVLVFFYRVQRIRHRRSMRLARRDRAEREAFRETVGGSYLQSRDAAPALPREERREPAPEDEPYEDEPYEDETPRVPLLQRLRELFSRRDEDEEDYEDLPYDDNPFVDDSTVKESSADAAPEEDTDDERVRP